MKPLGPLSAAAKLALLDAFTKSGIRPVDLAKRMGVRPQEITRILNPEHPTHIDTIANAFKALGLELVLKTKKKS